MKNVVDYIFHVLLKNNFKIFCYSLEHWTDINSTKYSSINWVKFNITTELMLFVFYKI